jgi:hypothetical protein
VVNNSFNDDNVVLQLGLQRHHLRPLADGMAGKSLRGPPQPKGNPADWRNEKVPPMTDIRKLTAVAILGLSMLTAPMAMAESDEGEVDAATAEKVNAQLTGEDYEVRKLEVEDGLIEAYVVKDGATSSLFLDPKTLEVVKTEG